MLLSVWAVVALAGVVYATPYQDELSAAVREKGGDALLWEPGTNFDLNTPDDLVHDSEFVTSGLASYRNASCPSLCYGHNVDPLIPDTFDARQKWPECDIGKVPDQGVCRADYAISATRAIADRICVASNGKTKTTISAQQVVSCCKDCGMGCRGGIPQEVWKYAKRRGIASGGDYNSNEGCQPYLKEPTGFSPNKSYGTQSYTTPKCSRKCYNQHYGKSKVREDLHKVRTPDKLCCSVKDELFNKGPVTTSMILFEDFLIYKSGIYHHVHGKHLGHITVKVIGFGVENKIQYWLAVNNWGTNWGDQGTFKILRENNGCEFEQYFYSASAQFELPCDAQVEGCPTFVHPWAASEQPREFVNSGGVGRCCPAATTYCPPSYKCCPPTDQCCPPASTCCPAASKCCADSSKCCPPTDKCCPPASQCCPAATSCCPDNFECCRASSFFSNSQELLLNNQQVLVKQPSNVVQQPASIVQQPASIVQQPASIVQQPARGCKAEFNCCPAASDCCPGNNKCCPVANICCAPASSCCAAASRCCLRTEECCPVATKCCPHTSKCCPAATLCCSRTMYHFQKHVLKK